MTIFVGLHPALRSIVHVGTFPQQPSSSVAKNAPTEALPLSSTRSCAISAAFTFVSHAPRPQISSPSSFGTNCSGDAAGTTSMWVTNAYSHSLPGTVEA